VPLGVVMVKRLHRRRGCGSRGGGVTPPVTSMPEGSNPKGEKKVIGQEKIFMGDVVGLMMSFQGM